jgi:hypothetical protein
MDVSIASRASREAAERLQRSVCLRAGLWMGGAALLYGLLLAVAIPERARIGHSAAAEAGLTAEIGLVTLAGIASRMHRSQRVGAAALGVRPWWFAGAAFAGGLLCWVAAWVLFGSPQSTWPALAAVRNGLLAVPAALGAFFGGRLGLRFLEGGWEAAGATSASPGLFTRLLIGLGALVASHMGALTPVLLAHMAFYTPFSIGAFLALPLFFAIPVIQPFAIAMGVWIVKGLRSDSERCSVLVISVAACAASWLAALALMLQSLWSPELPPVAGLDPVPQAPAGPQLIAQVAAASLAILIGAFLGSYWRLPARTGSIAR